VAAGDFTGDGVSDLVTANYYGLGLWEGNRDGTFQLPIDIALPAVYTPEYGGSLTQHPRSVATGDIDDDGIQDLIVGAPQFFASDVGYARTISGANGDVPFTYAPHDGTACNFGCAVAGGSFTGGNRVDVLIGACSYGGGDGIVELWLTVAASAANNGTGWSGTFGVPTFTARTDPVVGRNLGPAREGRCSSTRCSASRSRSPPAA